MSPSHGGVGRRNGPLARLGPIASALKARSGRSAAIAVLHAAPRGRVRGHGLIAEDANAVVVRISHPDLAARDDEHAPRVVDLSRAVAGVALNATPSSAEASLFKGFLLVGAAKPAESGARCV